MNSDLWADDYADFVFDGADDFDAEANEFSERALSREFEWGSVK